MFVLESEDYKAFIVSKFVIPSTKDSFEGKIEELFKLLRILPPAKLTWVPKKENFQ